MTLHEFSKKVSHFYGVEMLRLTTRTETNHMALTGAHMAQEIVKKLPPKAKEWDRGNKQFCTVYVDKISTALNAEEAVLKERLAECRATKKAVKRVRKELR